MSDGVVVTGAAQAVEALNAGASVLVDASTLRVLLRSAPRLAPLVSADSARRLFNLRPPSTTLKLHDATRLAHSPRSLPDDSEAVQTLLASLRRMDLTSERRSHIAEILRGLAGSEQDEARADRLDELVKHWMHQRLWSINLAPELVAHDDRHVAAVESLLATLVAPFVGTQGRFPSFAPYELEWLSVAAWLHDWGHVGGVVRNYRTGGSNPVVSRSPDVRNLHGLISQSLLSKTWLGMHGVSSEIAGPAGVLCGHHQSWTSFDSHAPQSTPKSAEVLKLLEALGVSAPSLAQDVAEQRTHGNIPSEVDLRRFQLLVALLRVADGADLGRHRVPDIGKGRSSFLAICVHREALRIANDLRRYSDPAAQNGARIADVIAAQALEGGEGHELHERLVSIDDDAVQNIDEIKHLRKYIEFIRRQRTYFEHHELVQSVHFALIDGKFDAVVQPSGSSTKAAEQAVNAASKDIVGELTNPGVRDVLGAHGIFFRVARTPTGHPHSAESAL